MYNSIMQLLLKGKLLPYQGQSVKGTAYEDLSQRINSENEYFKQFISTDDRRRFNQYHALITEQLAMESDVTDYKMLMIGISIGMEIAEHKQSLMTTIGVEENG